MFLEMWPNHIIFDSDKSWVPVWLFLVFLVLTLLMLEMEYSGPESLYHACWCTGSLS